MSAETPSGGQHRLVPMKVIICGVQRTGTLSMRYALFQLGFHDVYHMHSLVENSVKDAPQWVRAMEAKYAGKGSFGKEDWDKLLSRHQAVCDVPAAFFGAELAEMYPDAKVVILNRDPEKWYESVINSVYRVTRPGPVKGLLRLYCFLVDDVTHQLGRYIGKLRAHINPFDYGKDKDKALAWFKSQYDEYRERIPEERRLEYTVSDGWGPLCEFLEVPVPQVEDAETGKLVEAPFPRKNDREDFARTSDAMWAESVERANRKVLEQIGRAAVLALAGYAAYGVWRRL